MVSAALIIIRTQISCGIKQILPEVETAFYFSELGVQKSSPYRVFHKLSPYSQFLSTRKNPHQNGKLNKLIIRRRRPHIVHIDRPPFSTLYPNKCQRVPWDSGPDLYDHLPISFAPHLCLLFPPEGLEFSGYPE